MNKSRTALKFQLTINLMAWLLQYLEVLNIYNCKQWFCSGVPFMYFFLSAGNYIFFFREHEVMILTIATALVGSIGALFWDITIWNVATRHRTEYYDTHNFYANALWMSNFWFIVYIYVLKPKAHVVVVKTPKYDVY